MWQYRAICCNIYTKKESLFRLSCDPVGIRTQDPQLRRLLLYPAELPDQFCYAKLHIFFEFSKFIFLLSILILCHQTYYSVNEYRVRPKYIDRTLNIYCLY